ncbi:unnamed protein product [Trichogramma brassicae]|uniref:Peptidase S1 domain-containing protein n=1 Tax=Trichogramma brassicae TaxID=86971 RepID=A0A6H5IHE1_9HYME|nr:unnamed protein product [Trichogramma brassicae]
MERIMKTSVFTIRATAHTHGVAPLHTNAQCVVKPLRLLRDIYYCSTRARARLKILVLYTIVRGIRRDTHVAPAHSRPVNAKSHSDSTAVRDVILAYVHLRDATPPPRGEWELARSRACKSALRNFDLSLEDERREREKNKTQQQQQQQPRRAGSCIIHCARVGQSCESASSASDGNDINPWLRANEQGAVSHSLGVTATIGLLLIATLRGRERFKSNRASVLGVEVTASEVGSIAFKMPLKFDCFITFELSIYLCTTASDFQPPRFLTLTKFAPESVRRVALVRLKAWPVYNSESGRFNGAQYTAGEIGSSRCGCIDARGQRLIDRLCYNANLSRLARDPLDFLVGRRGREPRKSVELIREMRSYAIACDVAKGSQTCHKCTNQSPWALVSLSLSPLGYRSERIGSLERVINARGRGHTIVVRGIYRFGPLYAKVRVHLAGILPEDGEEKRTLRHRSKKHVMYAILVLMYYLIINTSCRYTSHASSKMSDKFEEISVNIYYTTWRDSWPNHIISSNYPLLQLSLPIKTYSIGNLYLSKPLKLSKHPQLSVLKLAEPGKSYVGQKAVITGYGINIPSVLFNSEGGREEKGIADGKLRFAKVNILDLEECRNAYKDHPIDDKTICGQVQQSSDKHAEGTCKLDMRADPLSVCAHVEGRRTPVSQWRIVTSCAPAAPHARASILGDEEKRELLFMYVYTISAAVSRSGQCIQSRDIKRIKVLTTNRRSGLESANCIRRSNGFRFYAPQIVARIYKEAQRGEKERRTSSCARLSRERASARALTHIFRRLSTYCSKLCLLFSEADFLYVLGNVIGPREGGGKRFHRESAIYCKHVVSGVRRNFKFAIATELLTSRVVAAVVCVSEARKSSPELSQSPRAQYTHSNCLRRDKIAARVCTGLCVSVCRIDSGVYTMETKKPYLRSSTHTTAATTTTTTTTIYSPGVNSVHPRLVVGVEPGLGSVGIGSELQVVLLLHLLPSFTRMLGALVTLPGQEELNRDPTVFVPVAVPGLVFGAGLRSNADWNRLKVRARSSRQNGLRSELASGVGSRSVADRGVDLRSDWLRNRLKVEARCMIQSLVEESGSWGTAFGSV